MIWSRIHRNYLNARKIYIAWQYLSNMLVWRKLTRKRSMARKSHCWQNTVLQLLKEGKSSSKISPASLVSAGRRIDLYRKELPAPAFTDHRCPSPTIRYSCHGSFRRNTQPVSVAPFQTSVKTVRCFSGPDDRAYDQKPLPRWKAFRTGKRK